MTDLIEYMKICVMNTHGEEQDKGESYGKKYYYIGIICVHS